MKTTVNVLVIDDSKNIIDKVTKHFSSHAVIHVVKTCTSGKEGLEYIINHQKDFDFLLMDIIMPEVDGICILEEMKQRNIKKNTIILTSYGKEEAIRLVSAYDIDYFMLKPVDMDVLEKRILAVENTSADPVEEKDSKVELAISRLLHSLGIPSHIRGYQYIRESIYMMYENPDMIGGVTKCIYPEVAMRFDTTASRVERAIRHAIEVSWARGDYELMDELFGHSVDFDRSKPTNSEFIATLADSLRLNKELLPA